MTIAGGIAGTFTIRLTHAEGAAKRDRDAREETPLSFTRFLENEKASREYDLRTGSGHFATYRCVVRCFLYCRCSSPGPVYARSGIFVFTSESVACL